MKSTLLALIAPLTIMMAREMPVERVNLGPVRVTLGETTFAEAAKALGTAPISHVGDAGESRYQACYASSVASNATYYLESDEMGSGDRITQFEAIARGSRTASEDSLITTTCGKFARPLQARTDRGIELGLSRKEVQRRLGSAGRDSSGIVIYYGSEMRRVKTFRGTAWSFLRLRYEAEQVVAFAAGAGITD